MDENERIPVVVTNVRIPFEDMVELAFKGIAALLVGLLAIAVILGLVVFVLFVIFGTLARTIQ